MDKTEYDAILSRDEQKAKDSLSKFIKNVITHNEKIQHF